MFLYLLVVILAGFGVHLIREQERTSVRAGELLLRWVLVGYCGIPMVIVAILLLADPAATLARFGFSADGPLVSFSGWAYLGMAGGAISTLRGPRTALLAPAICWATFFLGATITHLHAGHGASSHESLFFVLASHLLISLLLLTGVLLKGAR